MCDTGKDLTPEQASQLRGRSFITSSVRVRREEREYKQKGTVKDERSIREGLAVKTEDGA